MTIIKAITANELLIKNDLPIILLLSDDFLICDINPLGANEFFKKHKADMLNRSFIDVLLEQNIDISEAMNELRANQSALFKYLTFEHGTLGKKYAVTIIAIHEAKQSRYTVTMLAFNNSYHVYLNAIINNQPGAVYWKDLNGCYMGCNRFVANMAGFDSPDDMIGKTDYDLCWREFAKDWQLVDNKVIQDNTTIVREEKVRLANGSVITELTFKTPLKNEQNEIVGVIGTSLDITQRKEMEEHLRQSQIAAEAANLAKTEFIANMSHDIRTPLSGVVGMSELLESVIQNPEHKQYAQWLRDSGYQLLGMLNGILDVISAANVSEQDIQENSFDLAECIQDLVQLELPTTKLKKLTLQVEIDRTVPRYIKSDRTKLHRILLNLLGNAIKFTNSGQITIQVKCIDSTKSLARLQFCVIDTGIGIPQNLQDKVFDRFYRVSPSYKGTYAGHGVGLHIAQSYVQLLGGSLGLTSQEGIGTTFQFELSCKVGDNENTIPQNTSVPCQRTTKEPKEPYLLLVEDNLIAMKVIQSKAITAGYRFDAATDGETAFELATTNDYDLIITDLGLPGISGLEFTRRIREWETLRNKQSIPIVGLTAHTRETAMKDCLDHGMNDVFSKPITAEILKSLKVTYWLN